MQTALITITHRPSMKHNYIQGVATRKFMRGYAGKYINAGSHGRISYKDLPNGDVESVYKFTYLLK